MPPVHFLLFLLDILNILINVATIPIMHINSERTGIIRLYGHKGLASDVSIILKTNLKIEKIDAQNNTNRLIFFLISCTHHFL